MNVELDVPELYVALANYDTRELRVQKRFLEEQCKFIHCSSYRSGQELLEALRQGIPCDVVVLSGQLEDMDESELIAHLCRLTSKQLLLLFGEERHKESSLSCLRTDGSCYIDQQMALKDLLDELRKTSGQRVLQVEAFCRKLCAEWGLHSSDTKCAYLTSAVRTVCLCSEKLAIRKELLQNVSEKYHVSVAAVDSGLRRMISECEAQNTPGWRAFKQAHGFAGKKLTTGKLIYAVRDQLLLYRPAG